MKIIAKNSNGEIIFESDQVQTCEFRLDGADYATAKFNGYDYILDNYPGGGEMIINVQRTIPVPHLVS